MKVTMYHTGQMKVSPEHVTEDGGVMAHINEDGNPLALLLWISPEVAAQWIEALTPIAEGKEE